MYMTPSTTARTSAVRLLPPRFAGGISGPMSAHSSSVRSLGYRSLPRSYRARFSRVHMAAVLPAPAVSGQSQPIQMTQLVPGQTLRIRQNPQAETLTPRRPKGDEMRPDAAMVRPAAPSTPTSDARAQAESDETML